jgi:thiosulfate reductase cytochrome b subunit
MRSMRRPRTQAGSQHPAKTPNFAADSIMASPRSPGKGTGLPPSGLIVQIIQAMDDSNSVGHLAAPPAASAPDTAGDKLRHTPIVRVTHWITALCFLGLLVSGIELIISHPRFYWGEEGNVNTPALFSIPIPASRSSVPTGYRYVLADQNGWSRYLHFQTAWFVVLTGLVYALSSLASGHWRRNLVPSSTDLAPAALWKVVVNHLRFEPVGGEVTYNPLQRIAYLFVVFGAFPLMIWTGLAMSPAVTSALPFLVNVLGGHQSARTLHFFGTLVLVLFLLGHVLMVYRAGFRKRTRAMITGG